MTAPLHSFFSRPYVQLASLLSIGLSILLMGCASTAQPPSSASPTSTAQSSPEVQTQADRRGQVLPITAEAELAGTVIQLEVAETAQQQAMGLMFRPALPDNRGMLFPVDPPRAVRFWMRNVPVPLDMVFIQDGEVKAIAANVPSCTNPFCPTYGPNQPVSQVIELRGGRAAELGLQVGDRVSIRFL